MVGPTRVTRADVENAIPLVAAQLEPRTVGPRGDRISDREMEFLSTLAVHGGRTSTSEIATVLGRTQHELSWLREELIQEGDVYGPRLGQLAMPMPMCNRYILSHYELARPGASTELLSLDEMWANANLDDTAVATEATSPRHPRGAPPRR
ncbi:MAG: hypothetical protein L0H96_16900 [Humibacillus sp.]|nr:hypothetical protein [Humibacillus sp.]MDN5778575.1 hypothetical protein [Humibacillus sp.]